MDFNRYRPSGLKKPDVWSDVGLPNRGQALFVAVNDGLQVVVFDRLAALMRCDHTSLSQHLGITSSTLRRRLGAGRFSVKESDRIVRALQVFDAAVSMFEGNRITASAWMRSPVRGLGGKSPIEFLKTHVESAAVLDLIGRAEQGIFA